MTKSKSVDEYLKELEAKKDERPEQVRQGLEIYVGLWKDAIQKGVVRPSDEIEAALAKIEEKGGLQKISES